MLELTVTCSGRCLRDVIDLYNLFLLNRRLSDVIDRFMSEMTFTCQHRRLSDVIDLYMSQLTFTYQNRHLRDVIDLYARTCLKLLEDI